MFKNYDYDLKNELKQCTKSVHDLTHDYIERDNGIATAEICSLRDLENGNYHIYDKRTNR